MIGSQNPYWDEYSGDPDNWIQIPEFGVLPIPVNFEGFAFPIVGPFDGNEGLWRTAVYEAAKDVREVARSQFSSLSSLRAALITAEWTPDHEPLNWNDHQALAFRYTIFFHSIDRSLKNYRHKKAESVSHLASAMATATDLFRNKPVDAKALRREMARDGAIAKLAIDPKQAAKAKVRECWNAWQEKPHRYKSKAAFAKDMLDKYDELDSQAVIVRWCTRWERTQPA